MASGNFIIPPSYPPRTSVGSVEQWLASQLEGGGVSAPTLTPQQNIAASSARMAELQSQLGAPLTNTSGLGMMQMQAPAPLALNAAPIRAPSIPVSSEGEVLTGIGMRAAGPQAPRALTAGSGTQAGMVLANRAAEAEQAAGAADLGSKLFGAGSGGFFGAPAEGSLLARAKGLAGSKMGLAIGLPIAGQLAGMGVDAAGGPSELSGALKGAGAGAGIGMIAGAPGAVVGGLIGGGIGALAGPAQDLGWAEHYDDEATKTTKYATTLFNKDAGDLRHKFGQVSMAIQHGNSDKASRLLGVPVDVSTMQGKALTLQMMNKVMAEAAAHPNHYRDRLNGVQSDTKSKGNKKNQTAVQIQMGEAMAKLGANSTARGVAEQQMLNNLAGDPNMAAIAPVLRMDGQQRADFGQQTADAYTGAAYGDLQAQSQKRMMSTIDQLEQQLMAARISAASSSGGGSTSLADQANAILKRVG